MVNTKYLPYLVYGGVALFLIVVGVSNSILLTIQAGEAGVLFKKFGGGLDKDNVYYEGFQIIAPWNTMFVYDIRQQTAEESMDVLDKNGLLINVDVTVRFNPMPNKIGYVHERFGQGYISVLVIPEVRSTVRQVMGRYSAEEIYSTKRSEVETAIVTETTEVLSHDDNNIVMRALLIRSINLPVQIRNAIESKLTRELIKAQLKWILDNQNEYSKEFILAAREELAKREQEQIKAQLKWILDNQNEYSKEFVLAAGEELAKRENL